MRDVYAPICDGALWVRNTAVGHRTPLEWTTEWVRDRMWGGETLTNLVKQSLLDDVGGQTSEVVGRATTVPRSAGAPTPARVAPEAGGSLLDPGDLGLPIDGPLVVGAWQPVHAMPGVWAGVVQARYLDPAAALATGTSPLTDNERAANVYSVAVDLSSFDVGFEVGTDHPRVSWSGLVPGRSRDPKLPGPDGFATVAPLARTGMLDPSYQARLAAVFVGGFKRVHGAFRHGELSLVNGGSHYGFTQYGVELSRLQPGLATVVVWDDQRVDLLTWTAALLVGSGGFGTAPSRSHTSSWSGNKVLFSPLGRSFRCVFS